MNHLSAIEQRDIARSKISNQVNEFLRRGGEIQRLPITTRAPHRPHSYNAGSSGTDETRRAFELQQAQFEERVRELAVIEIAGVSIRRSPAEVARMMRAEGMSVSGPSVERIAARCGIELKGGWEDG